MTSPKSEAMEQARRTYLWHSGYDRQSEYEKNPDWSNDLRAKSVDDGSRTKVFDRFDPEHIWIASDESVNLFRYR